MQWLTRWLHPDYADALDAADEWICAHYGCEPGPLRYPDSRFCTRCGRRMFGDPRLRGLEGQRDINDPSKIKRPDVSDEDSGTDHLPPGATRMTGERINF